MVLNELDVGHAEMPFQGCPPCGDAWFLHDFGGSLRLMALDAIGHGPQANAVANFAIAQMERISGDRFRMWTIEDSLQMLDSAMRNRGVDHLAALALFDVERSTATLSGANVGNLEVYLLEEQRLTHLHATNGMIGGRLPTRIDVFNKPLSTGSCLVIHSDGVSTRGMRQFLQELQANRLFLSRSAQQLASQAVDRFGKSYDDASCTILRVL